MNLESTTTTDPGVIYPEISADYSDYLENIVSTGNDPPSPEASEGQSATSTYQNIQAATQPEADQPLAETASETVDVTTDVPIVAPASDSPQNEQLIEELINEDTQAAPTIAEGDVGVPPPEGVGTYQQLYLFDKNL